MNLEVGVQQAKSARARAAICNATIASLAEVGYAETSLNRVAAIADFSKGAVQHHFPTKEDLIAATVDALLLRTVQSRAAKPKSVEAALLNAWQRFINTPAYRALMEVLNAARTDLALRARISADLVDWGQKLDQQSLTSYRAVSGDADDVVMLLNMTRSFMRGLLIQEQYGVSAAATVDYVRKWIELIAPLLELKEDE
ncbi:MAG: TetR family transcriptional regulator [Proteobacteria bacterium]|nr:TetR family transcriptional regulator [Pseudomonadota bacterium]